jgi:hypothetical protein
VSTGIVLFENYSGGEYGRLGSAKAPAHTFTATNMLVTADGSLCVRPGLIKRNPSGLANGVVHGFGNTPVPLNDLWFVQGTAVRTFASDGTNLKTSGTALAETPAAPVDWKTDGTSILFASPEDKIYRVSPQGGVTVPTVAGLTGSPGAKCIEVYGDRIVAGDIDGSFDYRLRYSDVADPNSWPSANFVDVGDSYYLSGLYAQRQHLLIMKQNQIYVMTGSLGSSQVLRKVYTGNGPLHPLQARMGQRDLVWYQHLFAKHPATFDRLRAPPPGVHDRRPQQRRRVGVPPGARPGDDQLPDRRRCVRLRHRGQGGGFRQQRVDLPHLRGRRVRLRRQ